MGDSASSVAVQSKTRLVRYYRAVWKRGMTCMNTGNGMRVREEDGQGRFLGERKKIKGGPGSFRYIPYLPNSCCTCGYKRRN
jgi:hypothetical protein